jgi:hypothetical protein
MIFHYFTQIPGLPFEMQKEKDYRVYTRQGHIKVP